LPRRAWLARQKNEVLGRRMRMEGMVVVVVEVVFIVMVMISCMGWGIKG
jgi:hypothetical protein